jgi:hypothetical protein
MWLWIVPLMMKTVETIPQQTSLWNASHSLSQSLGKLYAPINRAKKFTTLPTTACGGFLKGLKVRQKTNTPGGMYF